MMNEIITALQPLVLLVATICWQGMFWDLIKYASVLLINYLSSRKSNKDVAKEAATDADTTNINTGGTTIDPEAEIVTGANGVDSEAPEICAKAGNAENNTCLEDSPG